MLVVRVLVSDHGKYCTYRRLGARKPGAGLITQSDVEPGWPCVRIAESERSVHASVAGEAARRSFCSGLQAGHLYAIADGEVAPEPGEPEVIFCVDEVGP